MADRRTWLQRLLNTPPTALEALEMDVVVKATAVPFSGWVLVSPGTQGKGCSSEHTFAAELPSGAELRIVVQDYYGLTSNGTWEGGRSGWLEVVADGDSLHAQSITGGVLWDLMVKLMISFVEAPREEEWRQKGDLDRAREHAREEEERLRRLHDAL